jgi:hypothetical protein
VSQKIGIAVAADRVRAVGVRRGVVLWALEAEVPGEAALATTLRDLLAHAPLPRRVRPRVGLAVGPSFSQVKLLRGLPPLTSSRTLARLVQEGAGRFFLRNGVPLLTTGVRVVGPGEVWAAAIEQQTVQQVESVCRELRLRLETIVPAAVALGRVMPHDQFVWHDGGVCLEVLCSAGILTAVKRCRAVDAPDPTTHSVEALASLGPDGWRYADAYGAAMVPAGEALVLHRGAGTVAPVPRWRMVAAFCACLLSMLTALILPGIAASRVAAQAEARLATLDVERRMAAEAEAELVRVTAALVEAAAFDAGRRSATLLLADLARALPEGSAVLTIRVDTAAGTMVVLSPRTASVLDPLERLPAIVSVEVVGPVTREQVGERALERVALRFALQRTPEVEPNPKPTEAP